MHHHQQQQHQQQTHQHVQNERKSAGETTSNEYLARFKRSHASLYDDNVLLGPSTLSEDDGKPFLLYVLDLCAIYVYMKCNFLILHYRKCTRIPAKVQCTCSYTDLNAKKLQSRYMEECIHVVLNFNWIFLAFFSLSCCIFTFFCFSVSSNTLDW